MPKGSKAAKAERAISRSLRKAHPGWSDKKVASVTYATENTAGLMRGNKATKRGASRAKKA